MKVLALATILSLQLASIAAPVWYAHGQQPQTQLRAELDDIVVFNVKTNKYHSQGCMAAKRCTVNCINITRAEAHQRGGLPCQICGGGEYCTHGGRREARAGG